MTATSNGIHLIIALIIGFCVMTSKSESIEDVKLLSSRANTISASFPPYVDKVSFPLQFSTENNTTITTQIGSTAFVPCIIQNIGDGMVSWIRKKDYHLLTVGLTTYSSDARFQAIHLNHLEDWTLRIKYVQKRDAGVYECQVSSHPPTSIFLELSVFVAKAEISGPNEKYLKPGSSLQLFCYIPQTTESPSYIFWYLNNRKINYDINKHININTNLTDKTSVLTITYTETEHSGNYSCAPSNSNPAYTYVHILNGENLAAMQRGDNSLSWLRCPSSWIFLITLFTIIC